MITYTNMALTESLHSTWSHDLRDSREEGIIPVWYVVDVVALGQDFTGYFTFNLSIIIPLVLHMPLLVVIDTCNRPISSGNTKGLSPSHLKNKRGIKTGYSLVHPATEIHFSVEFSKSQS